jgi:hypothetical protein
MLKSGVGDIGFWSGICPRRCKIMALSESGCKLLDWLPDSNKVCMIVLHNDNMMIS